MTNECLSILRIECRRNVAPTVKHACYFDAGSALTIKDHVVADRKGSNRSIEFRSFATHLG